MPSDPFDDIFQRACHDLTREDQLRLIQKLASHASATNGADGEKSLYDALKDRGIIGSITDAPPDLGTNPRYMEGFGQHAS